MQTLQNSILVKIHFEHPHELTPQIIKAVKNLRKMGAVLISKTKRLKCTRSKIREKK